MLCLVLYCLLKKGNGIIELILEPDEIKHLFKKCHEILDSGIDLHVLCLKLLLISIVTPVDNLNENSLIEYLMNENFFDSLIKLVQTNSTKTQEANDVVLVIILLANFRKNEGRNPYIVQLSIFANESALISFAEIINSKLLE